MKGSNHYICKSGGDDSMKRLIRFACMGLVFFSSIQLFSSRLNAQSRFGNRSEQPRDGVCFYTDENYRGESYCVGAGDSRRNLEGRINDRFSSVQVFNGAQVVVFQDENFGGPRTTFTGNIPNLRTWNDRISSFQVSGNRLFGGPIEGDRRSERPFGEDIGGRNNEPRNGVCFYTDENYRGESYCAEVGENRRNVEDRYNDRFSSLRIFGRAQVVVFENDNFGGPSTTFTSDIPNLRNWNDRITSFQVSGNRQSGGLFGGRPSGQDTGGYGRDNEPRSGACLYTNENYLGDRFCISEGESIRNVRDRFNDRISSIRVFGKARVTIYEDENFRGVSRTFNRDVPNLRGFNDRLSSIEIR
jgi:hypothetical protein